MPARSLWIIFSVMSRCSEARRVSHPASDNPPALPRSLWQPAQYCDTNSACAAGAIVVACDATGVDRRPRCLGDSLSRSETAEGGHDAG